MKLKKTDRKAVNYPDFRVAAVTMCRDDLFFLERWITYYGKALGKENLFIILDGEDQKLPSNAEDVTIKIIPHQILKRAEGDKYRIGLLNMLSQDLFLKGYYAVIGTDCDEFLVVDPSSNLSLLSFLYAYYQKGYLSLSALGIDLGQNLHTEKTLDTTLPILSQRHFGILSSRYTKASVKFSPSITWGSGFHRIKNHNFHIAPSFYLFHTGYCCISCLNKRLFNTTRIEGGWENHLGRRGKTIQLVTEKKAIDGDNLLNKARFLQEIFRPLYAWNKPLMPLSNKAITIPLRFQNVLF